MIAEVPSAVLGAFGASAPAVRLPGGQGTAFRAGDVVLKPTGLEAEAEWTAGVFERLVEDGFRVPRPVRASNGKAVVDGWVAWRIIVGEHEGGRWAERLEVCRAFHRALEGIARPAFLDERVDRWAVADRIAWGELPLPAASGDIAALERLAAMRRPTAGLRNQVIHGDIQGNVLFADGMAPAVIDFAPYWRPAGFAAAVLVVDALAWEGADESILELCGDFAAFPQLLVRAQLRRMAEVGDAAKLRDVRIWREANGPVVDLVCRLAERSL
jgi:uncharacterized protein (TIGR02569 family)